MQPPVPVREPLQAPEQQVPETAWAQMTVSRRSTRSHDDRPVADDGRPVPDECHPHPRSRDQPPVDDGRPLLTVAAPVVDDRSAPREPEGDPRFAEGQGQREGVDGVRDPRAPEDDSRLTDRSYDPRATEQRTFEDPDSPRH